jgi:hypothetical protein
MPAREQAAPVFVQQLHVLLPDFFLQHCLACSYLNLSSRSNEAQSGGQEAVGWDGQLGGNPTWPPTSIVLTVCGCHAAGDEVTR